MNVATQARHVDPRDAEPRREGLVGLAMVGHPPGQPGNGGVCHALNVRSSYISRQGDCAQTDIDRCAVSVHISGMTPADYAARLKKARLRKKLTLMGAATLIDAEAERQKIDPEGRSVPRTHASLIRWESGKVPVKLLGLAVIASAYGVDLDELTNPDWADPDIEADVKRYRSFRKNHGT